MLHNYASLSKKLFICAWGARASWKSTHLFRQSFPIAAQQEKKMPEINWCRKTEIIWNVSIIGARTVAHAHAHIHQTPHVSVNNCYLKLKLDRTKPERSRLVQSVRCIVSLNWWIDFQSLPPNIVHRIAAMEKCERSFVHPPNCCENRPTRFVQPQRLRLGNACAWHLYCKCMSFCSETIFICGDGLFGSTPWIELIPFSKERASTSPWLNRSRNEFGYEISV